MNAIKEKKMMEDDEAHYWFEKGYKEGYLAGCEKAIKLIAGFQMYKPLIIVTPKEKEIK